MGNKCEQYKLSNFEAEILFNYPHLSPVRYAVCKSVFDRIISQISKSIHYYVREGEGSYMIFLNNSKIEVSLNENGK